MTTPYLILHKVRGEPAFDIAIPVTIGEEEGWIIPTSGHRAYPLWNCTLDKLNFLNGKAPNWYVEVVSRILHEVPDHYSLNTPPSLPLTTASALLAKLGFGPKAIKRRRIE